MRRRLSCLAGIAAVAALAAWGWYATRPSLVWWTSPPIGSKRLRVRMLMPRGWALAAGTKQMTAADEVESWTFEPPQAYIPAWLCQLIAPREPRAILELSLVPWPLDSSSGIRVDPVYTHFVASPPYYRASAGLDVTDAARHAHASIIYFRTNKAAFDATHRAICDSLRILEPGEK